MGWMIASECLVEFLELVDDRYLEGVVVEYSGAGSLLVEIDRAALDGGCCGRNQFFESVVLARVGLGSLCWWPCDWAGGCCRSLGVG